MEASKPDPHLASSYCLQAIEEFEALVAQIGKSTLLIERVIRQIATAPLVPSQLPSGSSEPSSERPPEAGAVAGSGGGVGGAARNIGEGGDRVPDMQEAYETYEQHRLQVRLCSSALVPGQGCHLLKLRACTGVKFSCCLAQQVSCL